ncbi:MAG: DUF1015 family protein [Lachnospiraceae bacterium]|nr:DUF1015 family protein [Lachnospiraceae bacterium]
MADIRPFKAVRPKTEEAGIIAALPYDVYSREEAVEEVKGKDLSFLRIDRAETNFGEEVDTYAPEVYEKAASLFDEFQNKGHLIEDKAPCYYIYELIMDGRHQSGIVATASADDYRNNIIKKHENTLESKEADRIRHVDALSAQTGPIFLGYREREDLTGLINTIKMRDEAEIFDFTSPDGIIHKGWIIDHPEDIDKITKAFEEINEIYICDGHHRCASAVKVCEKRRQSDKDYNGDKEYNYFLSVLFADSELKIYDYNRAVKDLNGLSESRFLDRIRKKFIIEEAEGQVKPSKKGEFGMYISGKWYKLTIKPGIIQDDVVEELDVSILQNELLAPILNIEDPKRDSRISFVGGIRGLGELERLVDSGKYSVSFAMYPTDIGELFAVADAGRLMPPKSTWFEPKLRSGLFIHKF